MGFVGRGILDVQCATSRDGLTKLAALVLVDQTLSTLPSSAKLFLDHWLRLEPVAVLAVSVGAPEDFGVSEAFGKACG